MNNLIRRVTKLEGVSSTGDIAIWGDDPDDVPPKVHEMIRAGRIAEADRRRCVHWSKAKSVPGAHEDALDQILAWEAEAEAEAKAAHDTAP